MQCLANKYGLISLENREIHNQFCDMYEGRTCCDMKDAIKLRNSFELISRRGDI